MGSNSQTRNNTNGESKTKRDRGTESGQYSIGNVTQTRQDEIKIKNQLVMLGRYAQLLTMTVF